MSIWLPCNEFIVSTRPKKVIIGDVIQANKTYSNAINGEV